MSYSRSMNNATTRHMSAVDRCKAIRAELKRRHGYTSRQVSVRKDSYSMGATIYVTIKDASIKLSDVEAVASAFGTVRRCEVTGEILGGGNTYLAVEYDAACVVPLMGKILELLDGDYIKLGTVSLERDASRDEWQAREHSPDGSGRMVCRAWRKDGLARLLAERMLNGQLAGMVLAQPSEPEVNAQVAFLQHIGAA